MEGFSDLHLNRGTVPKREARSLMIPWPMNDARTKCRGKPLATKGLSVRIPRIAAISLRTSGNFAKSGQNLMILRPEFVNFAVFLPVFSLSAHRHSAKLASDFTKTVSVSPELAPIAPSGYVPICAKMSHPVSAYITCVFSLS